MEHIVSIGPDGSIKSMHTDKFSLSFLGTQRVERASDIRWAEEAQSWSIWFSDKGQYLSPGEAYSGFDSYESARDFEILVMNESLRHQTTPFDTAIIGWAKKHR